MAHRQQCLLKHSLLAGGQKFLVGFQIQLRLNFRGPCSLAGGDGFSGRSFFLDQFLTAVGDLRGGVEEAGNTKTEEYFDKFSRGGFDLSLLFGVEFFNLPFQLFVNFLNLFDVLLLPVSALLGRHPVSFLLLGLLGFVFEPERRHHILLDFDVFDEFLGSFRLRRPLLGVIPLELQFYFLQGGEKGLFDGF